MYAFVVLPIVRLCCWGLGNCGRGVFSSTATKEGATRIIKDIEREREREREREIHPKKRTGREKECERAPDTMKP